MNQRYSVFFSNLALLIFPIAMFASSITLALAASALAFVGWLHGLLAAARCARWGWVVAMLGSGALLVLAWLQSDSTHVQLGFLHMLFLYPDDAPVFLWVLPGYLLAPTVLHGIAARAQPSSERAVLGSADYTSAATRRALAMGNAHPQALSGGLILLGLFLILASWRFGGGGMTLLLYF
jgi:hypothetical protein